MTRNGMTLVALLTAAVLTGCDNPPAPTRLADGRSVEMVSVGANDPELHAATRAAEEARANYQYRIEVIKAYYDRIGNAYKFDWAQKELKNLQQAQWFRWEGVGEIKPAGGETVSGADELILAEAAVSARMEWIARMNNLAAMFETRGMTELASTVRRAVDRLDPIRTYCYVPSAEVPPASLRPTKADPEAEQMFQKAYAMFRSGKGLFPALGTSYEKEREALLIFKDLVFKHPDSTRIALSAYYIADIYKEYFNENLRALWWYERAWQWDPHVPEPARFQAGTVCERTHDYPHAIEYYKASLEFDPPRLGNADFARKRIEELQKLIPAKKPATLKPTPAKKP